MHNRHFGYKPVSYKKIFLVHLKNIIQICLSTLNNIKT